MCMYMKHKTLLFNALNGTLLLIIASFICQNVQIYFYFILIFIIVVVIVIVANIFFSSVLCSYEDSSLGSLNSVFIPFHLEI